MAWQDRIERVPGVLSGKPVIKNTRISVQLIMEFLVSEVSEDEILEQYSHITREDIAACRECAASGEQLSPMTWAEWEEAVFGEEDRERERKIKSGAY